MSHHESRKGQIDGRIHKEIRQLPPLSFASGGCELVLGRETTRTVKAAWREGCAKQNICTGVHVLSNFLLYSPASCNTPSGISSEHESIS